jgi:hypothetical protein
MRQLELQQAVGLAVRDAVRSERIRPAPVAPLRHADRLAIHARHYRASLTAVLAAAFPAARRLTGEGFFAFAAAQFIANEPPQDPVLDHYGAGFPAFLARFPASAPFRWLPHLARFEWALHGVSLARPGCPVEALPEGAGAAALRWKPAAALFAAPYAVDALTGKEPRVADFEPADRFLLILGQAAAVSVHALAWGEFACLSALRAGRCIEDAVALALTVDAAFSPVSVLRLACTGGAIEFVPPAERSSP